MIDPPIFLNRETYLDKVLGCWAGKNIGGTLGGPLEGRIETFDVDFYIHNLDGDPLPNDDLDLQLVWLRALEDNGVFRTNEQVLGEYWMRYIDGPWGEYGVAKSNLAKGILPPLSGLIGNDEKKISNGAWIRSEIWACVFPAEPEWAAWFAWYDACVDHAGDGIWAEVFTAALESAAFVESDIRTVINAGLNRIPKDSRVARAVLLAIDYYDKGMTWLEARNAVVKDSEDLGWFMAPGNVAFVVIGLLYGEGDFGKSICTACNCGDDTDCTAGTVGAILGIIQGYKAIPQKWIEPIGNTIKSIAIRPYGFKAPATVDELTARVAAVKEAASAEHRELARLTDGETKLPADIHQRIEKGWFTSVMDYRRSNSLIFRLPWCFFTVEYKSDTEIEAGKPITLRLIAEFTHEETTNLNISWEYLPADWTITPGTEQSLMLRSGNFSELEVTITPGEEIDDSVTFIPLKLNISSRRGPLFVTIPFHLKGSYAPSLTKKNAGAFSSIHNGMENCHIVYK